MTTKFRPLYELANSSPTFLRLGSARAEAGKQDRRISGFTQKSTKIIQRSAINRKEDFTKTANRGEFWVGDD